MQLRNRLESMTTKREKCFRPTLNNCPLETPFASTVLPTSTFSEESQSTVWRANPFHDGVGVARAHHIYAVGGDADLTRCRETVENLLAGERA
jgi:hypothetical protein